MIKVNCPNCGVRLTASDDHVGKPVNCQKCNTKFILSKRWTNEPLEVVADSQDRLESGNKDSHDSPGRNQFTVPIDFSSATSSGVSMLEQSAPLSRATSNSATPWEAIARQEDAARRHAVHLDGYVEARSLVEFFDFRFRRYLTPWIIRVSWPLVMTGALIWIMVVSYTFVSALIASGDLSVGPSENLPAASMAEEVANQKNLFVISPFFMKSGLFLTGLITITLGLLWIRVVFETIILLFSIANTLRVIEDHEKTS